MADDSKKGFIHIEQMKEPSDEMITELGSDIDRAALLVYTS